MDTDRLDRQFSFLEEIDGEKGITRQNYIGDGSRRETDTDHAWHMAVMAMVLSEYAGEKIDLLKTIEMILIHDLVEVYAGDTYAYDENAKKSQADREKSAAEKIFSLLPPDQCEKLKGLWEEFEQRLSAEAKFARAMDNIQPIMLNSLSSGKSWLENGVKLSWILKRNEITPKASEKLWEYAKENYLSPSIKKGYIENDM